MIRTLLLVACTAGCAPFPATTAHATLGQRFVRDDTGWQDVDPVQALGVLVAVAEGGSFGPEFGLQFMNLDSDESRLVPRWDSVESIELSAGVRYTVDLSERVHGYVAAGAGWMNLDFEGNSDFLPGPTDQENVFFGYLRAGGYLDLVGPLQAGLDLRYVAGNDFEAFDIYSDSNQSVDGLDVSLLLGVTF